MTGRVETKVAAAAVGAAGAGGVLTPLVLYVMAKFGEDAGDPLVVGAAAVIAFLVYGAASFAAGWYRSSRTSRVSDGYMAPTARTPPDDA